MVLVLAQYELTSKACVSENTASAPTAAFVPVPDAPTERFVAIAPITPWLKASRLHPLIPRESKRSMALYRSRGAVEREFGRLKNDWAMAPLAEAERRDFLEISDARYQVRSTLLTSQLPVASWHPQIGDPTVADSILDRLVHNAHRIELKGESMRKKRNAKTGGENS